MRVRRLGRAGPIWQRAFADVLARELTRTEAMVSTIASVFGRLGVLLAGAESEETPEQHQRDSELPSQTIATALGMGERADQPHAEDQDDPTGDPECESPCDGTADLGVEPAERVSFHDAHLSRCSS